MRAAVTTSRAPALSPVGEVLREWRGVRGLSQLDLALEADVSSRHVSFIETGRSRPSRRMLLKLAEVLDLPLRERNALLLAAGYAPLYGESELDHAGLEPVRRALELVLANHEPYPAFVLDRRWDIRLANRPHRLLLPLLLPPGAEPGDPANAFRLVLDPALLRPRIRDWELVAHVLGHRVRRQLRLPHLEPELREHYQGLLALPGVREAMAEVQPPPDAGVVIPLTFEIEIEGRSHELSWFSTLATLGTPLDVTAEELLVESLFPADEATRELVEPLAESLPETPG